MATKYGPFTTGGTLDHCPDCGATGDYKLLADRVLRLWSAYLADPDSITDPTIFALLQDARNVIDKKVIRK